ncbi:similar to Saccharomyces cerevisiae YLL018C-A COX19 Protein required for cytochrome c oxidase assembly, located in the cytosol and mitochondrial intermembrane space [Maudiozyma barnettii]|uniref:Similar to Saccharomyces cerevisiae YLL018C-A COX19 Protein required for cytochrome c oxidase assembly, located in the cytosol and mitochondrial intermembrane space n=1 Tax=Maudiozyma barnettii TaxID=61262 RepID=A0A8H2ZFB5_9SACH|nr:Cox19p [Kazachstania barnettii]CAB4253061.1 similar to Saccharomyces cerevisiae YLL018C-A COX19 Protein required for cytochrome c oxidase assembly, located in the cytosol and mitochondrial intermembrane space [Kazachstania barnettii]CAD1780404.1 similar to Saccharomyces cerevisiae YLL018C-A COX19 Protein required for cytochrome c oxidase assembly, located in the cytosol and mitochondrial intermembrane space [Kazachstania barnettii]
MSGNPGNSLRALSPTPPERGSFPLDHDNECVTQMQKYLNCMKLVGNENAPNCRLLAKEYLRCRMDHKLMDRDDWNHLGLPRDIGEKDDKTTAAEHKDERYFGEGK